MQFLWFSFKGKTPQLIRIKFTYHTLKFNNKTNACHNTIANKNLQNINTRNKTQCLFHKNKHPSLKPFCYYVHIFQNRKQRTKSEGPFDYSIYHSLVIHSRLDVKTLFLWNIYVFSVFPWAASYGFSVRCCHQLTSSANNVTTAS
jgi:hypothetical protein